MALQAERSDAAMAVLQLFYASGKTRLCEDSYDLRRLDVSEEDAVAALGELRDEGLLGPTKRDDAMELTRQGRAVTQGLWPRGQLPDASGPRRVVGHFSGAWDLPVRIAIPVADLLGIVPRTVSFDRHMPDRGGGFSAWQLVHPPTGVTEDRFLVGLHAAPGTDAGHSSGPNQDWVSRWLSVDPVGEVREGRRGLEEIVFLIAMGAA